MPPCVEPNGPEQRVRAQEPVGAAVHGDPQPGSNARRGPARRGRAAPPRSRPCPPCARRPARPLPRGARPRRAGDGRRAPRATGRSPGRAVPRPRPRRRAGPARADDVGAGQRVRDLQDLERAVVGCRSRLDELEAAARRRAEHEDVAHVAELKEPRAFRAPREPRGGGQERQRPTRLEPRELPVGRPEQAPADPGGRPDGVDGGKSRAPGRIPARGAVR